MSFATKPSVSNVTTAPATTLLFPVGPLLDLEAGDVVYGADGHLIWADAITTWIQRVMQMIYVRRYSTPIYPAGIGNTFDLDGLQGSQSAVQAAVQADITAICAADPWTKAVDGFAFSWNGDALSVTCTITSRNGDEATITVPVSITGSTL